MNVPDLSRSSGVARLGDDVVVAGRSIYAAVWGVHARLLRRRPLTKAQRSHIELVLGRLARAHMICFPPGQVAAQPTDDDELLAEVKTVRAPFSPVFLACGDRFPPGAITAPPLYAALLVDEGDERGCLPFFQTSDGQVTPTVGAAVIAPGGDVAIGWRPGLEEAPHQTREDLESVVITGTIRALLALYLLESANVDLREAQAAPQGHRAAGVPSHEVVIRQPKARYRPRADHDHPDWSHRWEVRGHYKHFRRGPIFEANLDRRIARPDGDEFVRIWCPPHVKGPESKPLVPKIRRYAEESSNDPTTWKEVAPTPN